MWILLLAIVSLDGITSQRIEMDETSCKHYEQQYNSGHHNAVIVVDRNRPSLIIGYRAQCLHPVLKLGDLKK